jgi:hypothetical protein
MQAPWSLGQGERTMFLTIKPSKQKHFRVVLTFSTKIEFLF